MSIIICKHCGIKVDTDFDAEHEDECGAEEVCEHCGGEGEVSAMGQVYPGEPHMADIETEPCPFCQGVDEQDEYDPDLD